jgi:hypothetical protein
MAHSQVLPPDCSLDEWRVVPESTRLQIASERMHILPSSKFEHTGVFEGFVRNREGKKRLILRLRDDSQLEFKVERDLREKYEDELEPGALITVTGFQKFSLPVKIKRVIQRIRIQFSPPRKVDHCAKCPIHVCAKKNCWKSGGKELMAELRLKIHAAGLDDAVDLRSVGCLDECKKAPNIEFGKKVLTRCSSDTVDQIIASLLERKNGQG